jgi:fructan beta-fructosidase
MAFAWMNNWKYASLLPTSPWRGQMTTARDLKLYIYAYPTKQPVTYKFFLSNTPNRDLNLYRITPPEGSSRVMNITNNTDNITALNAKIKQFLNNNNNPELLQIIVNFTKPVGDYDFGFYLRSNYLNDDSNPKTRRTVVGVKRNHTIVVNRTQSGNTLGTDDFKQVKEIQMEWDTYNEQWGKIEVLLDRSSIEAFFFSWMSVTELIYPDDDSARGVEIWASDLDNVRVAWMYIAVLDSAYKNLAPTAAEQ